ncbi:uncharacterized protein K02A2.6-like [Rana temporaria]|uniref:uncharacterized protein K02A2.6-like n=1 Tax=Rana temporaria TaxID=8407 RepID=UPI001AACDB0E|nr:uncharacterized protein K02A2.6-like [Rana temporaria]
MAHLLLKPGATPRFCKARSVPFALRKKVVALNNQLLVDQYQLPRLEDLFGSLAAGQKFTKIDLKQAYLQLQVHPDSRHLLTINTHKGLFQYNRMVFGIAQAPAIWQRIMNESQLEFCAHTVDRHGLHTTEEKVKALTHAPTPRNVTQLRSYLGLLNYYHRFLPNLAHQLYPLHRLLDARAKWIWTDKCEEAFRLTKELILSSLFLSQIFSYVQTGWPERVSGEFRPYFARKCELVTNAGCLQWGNRVIVPQYLQSTMLRILHEGHPGVVRMKQRARSYVWWPQMDTAIEDYVAQCPGCRQAQRPQKRGTLQPWPWPTEPWSRLHLDFAGPIQGKMYLIVVDAHSKWPEVFQMPSITSAATILVLRKLFAQYGLPTAIVSDNGTQFTSHEFQSFLSGLGVQHYKTAPYHPASNGLAERFVQTFKKHLLSTLDQVGLSEESCWNS